MSSSPFLDDVLEEGKKSTGPFLDEVLSSPIPEKHKVEEKSLLENVIDFSKKAYNTIAEGQGKAAQERVMSVLPKYSPPKPEAKDDPVKFPPALRGYAESYFGLPRAREREGADLADDIVTPAMSAMKPWKAKQELAKPLPMPKYTGSTGEQLLSSFMSNLVGAPTTPQGILGEWPIGAVGKIIGSIPELGLMGKGFHWATQAIVKGLPEGMKAITEASIKLGFTTDMLSSALNNAVGFKEAFQAGDKQGMIDTGSSVLIDSLFGFMIAKGLPGDAKKLADFKVAMNAADASGVPRSQFIQGYGIGTAKPSAPTRGGYTEAELGPSEELKVAADKTAYEPEIKQTIKTANAEVVRTKNVRTKKAPVQQDPISFIDELLEGPKEDLAKLKDWSDYPPDAEVSKQKGKKKEELVVEDYEEAKEDVEIKDIDFEIGEKAPESLTTEASPFRTDKDVTVAQARNYEKSPVVARDWSELTGPESVKSPLVTVSKLVNDFNQHLDGNFKGDIEQSKDFISKIAANVSEFEPLFEGDKAEFKEFETFVSDAAKWMRSTSKKGTGTSLYFGLPIDEAYNMMKPWFSALRKFAEEKLPNRATGAQIFNTLRKNSTRDEWDSVGLESVFRPEALIEKKDVLKAIDEGTVEFRDVLLESNRSNRILGEEGEPAYGEYGVNEPKFSSYVEPGGTNYKEMFVTAPSKDIRPTFPEMQEVKDYFGITDIEWDHYRQSVRNEKIDEFIHRNPYSSLRDSPQWRDPHPDYSDIENPIVRLRINDRVGSQGEKVLFIEELQICQGPNDDYIPRIFSKRWREIGMKRAIKYGIDNGYDVVAWTTGEMQANRYSLDKVADQISYYPKSKQLAAYKDGQEVARHYDIERSDVQKYVGKEVADKLLDDSSFNVVRGKDLKLEEKGLRKLYDQDIPNVVKKLGGEVRESNLDFSTELDKKLIEAERQREEWANRNVINRAVDAIDRLVIKKVDANKNVKSVQYTPLSSLKSKAEKGFSLYSGIPTDLLEIAGKKALAYEKEVADAAKIKFKDQFKNAKELFKFHYLNQSGNAKLAIEKQGDKAYEVLQATALARGSHPRAVNEYKQSSKETFNGLSKDEIRIVDRLVLAKTVIDISKSPKGDKVTYPKNYSPEEAKFLIDNIGSGRVNSYKDYSPQEELLVRKAVDTYFNSEKRVVDDAFETGLIDAWEREALKSRNYSRMTPARVPTIADIADRKKLLPGSSKDYVWDSGYEVMKQGGGNNLFAINSRLKMLEFYDRFYNRIMTNKAKVAMVDFAKSSPSNPFAYVDKPEIVNLGKQPSDVTGLRRSITIKRYEAKIGDYQFKDIVKEKFSNGFKNLNISQLKELDISLGEVSKGYKRLPKHPKGWKKDTYYENGSEKDFWLEPKFASEWMTDTKDLSGPIAKWIRIFSGSQIVKMFATGINPAFAIANLPRDVMHAWFASRIMEDGKWTSLYSVFAPKAAGEFLVDYKDVFNDVLHRRGVVNDFIEDGGGMNYLYSQGKLTDIGIGAKNKVRLETPFDKVYEFMSYINETSELLTRLGIRNRVIKRRAAELGMSYEAAKKDPKIRKEATYAAIDQMNFSEGGSFTKALDNAIPYLNARIVGTRSLWRVFQPGSGTAEQSALKLGQFAALVVGAYLLNKKRNPQGMEDLKNDPRTNSSFAIPFSKDAGVLVDGQTRYPFFGLPIDSSQAFFKVLFEGLADKMTGGDVNPEKIVGSLKNTLPADISSLPPTAQALIGYYTNTDIWRGEEIWKNMQGTIPYKGPQWLTGDPIKGSELEQIPGRTPEIYKDLGTATGLSPERLKYMIESLLTSDNVYSQITFSAYDKVFGGLDDGQKKQLLSEAMSRTSGIKRFYGLTNPAAQDVKEARDINQDRINIRMEQDIKFDSLVDGYLNRKDTKLSEVVKFVNSQKDPLDQQRMFDDLDFARDIKDLPNKRWWMQLKRMDVQGRAEAYVARLEKAKEIDKRNGNNNLVHQIMKEASRFGTEEGQIKGVITEDFEERVGAIRIK